MVEENRHSRDRCMECPSKPEIECLWAEGMGHAWFCMKCFKEWATKGDGKGEICSVKKIQNGKASNKWRDNTSPNIEGTLDFLKKQENVKELLSFQKLFEAIESIKIVDKILETYKRVEADKKVIITSGIEVIPVATLADEYGGRAQIIVDDNCYCLLLRQDDGKYKQVSWIFSEAHEVLKDLPSPEEVCKMKVQKAAMES